MAEDIALGKFIHILQEELQRSYELARIIADEREGVGVQLTVTDCEIDLPINLSVAKVTLTQSDLDADLSQLSKADLASIRLELPEVPEAVEKELRQRLDTFSGKMQTDDPAEKRLGSVEASQAPKAKSTAKTVASAKAPEILGYKPIVHIASPESAVGDFITAARIKLTFKAAFRSTG